MKSRPHVSLGWLMPVKYAATVANIAPASNPKAHPSLE
jgi:hypothetical protein